MNARFLLLLLWSSLLFTVSCSDDKKDNAAAVLPEHNVYCSGYDRNEASVCTPVYWTGIVQTQLAGANTACSAIAYGLAVSGTTVYTAGYHTDPTHIYPCYWIGTTRTDLDVDVGCKAPVSSMALYNGTVYSVGHHADSGFTAYYPCSWTGTARTALDQGTSTKGAAADIFINDSGAKFICGYYENGTQRNACLWSGETLSLTKLSDSASETTQPSSIFVSGADVYIGGYRWDGTNPCVPCYWKNGERVDLAGTGDDAFVEGIFVDAGTVYCAGYYSNTEGTGIPCYWKNAQRVDLPSDAANKHPASVKAITVKDGVVYTAGNYSNGTVYIPCYWKNTTRTDLEYSGIYSSATSIAVTPKTAE